MKRSTSQGEIPASLKRIAFWGDNDCVCQPGLLWLYYSFLCWVPLSLFSRLGRRTAPVVTRRQGQEATCHAVQCGLFAGVRCRQIAVMKYSHPPSSVASWNIRVKVTCYSSSLIYMPLRTLRVISQQTKNESAVILIICLTKTKKIVKMPTIIE